MNSMKKDIKNTLILVASAAVSLIFLLLSLRYADFTMRQFFVSAVLFLVLSSVIFFLRQTILKSAGYSILSLQIIVYFFYLFLLLLIYFSTVSDFSAHDIIVFALPITSGMILYQLLLTPEDILSYPRGKNGVMIIMFLVTGFLHTLFLIENNFWAEKNDILSQSLKSESINQDRVLTIMLEKSGDIGAYKHKLLKKVPAIIVDKIIDGEYGDIARYVPFKKMDLPNGAVLIVGTTAGMTFPLNIFAAFIFIIFFITIAWFSNILQLQTDVILSLFEENLDAVEKKQYSNLKLDPSIKRSFLNIRVFNLLNRIISIFREKESSLQKQLLMEIEQNNIKLNKYKEEKARFIRMENDLRKKIMYHESHIKKLHKDKEKIVSKFRNYFIFFKETLKNLETNMQSILNGRLPEFQKNISRTLKDMEEGNKRVFSIEQGIVDNVEKYEKIFYSLKHMLDQLSDLFISIRTVSEFELVSDLEKLNEIFSIIDTVEQNRESSYHELKQALNTVLFSLISLSKHVQTSKLLDNEYIVSIISNIQNDINKTLTMVGNISGEVIEARIKDGKDIAGNLKQEQYTMISFIEQQIGQKDTLIPEVELSLSVVDKSIENNLNIQHEIKNLSKLIKILVDNTSNSKSNIGNTNLEESILKQISDLQSKLLAISF